MKVWLDDYRDMPAAFDVHAKNFADAMSLLASGDVTFISLDHDLGYPNDGSGYDVAKWIEAQARLGNLKRLKWDIHSANPVGVKNIRAALEQADKFWDQHEEENDG